MITINTVFTTMLETFDRIGMKNTPRNRYNYLRGWLAAFPSKSKLNRALRREIFIDRILMHFPWSD